MQVEKGVIRVGLEVEVADWKNGYSYQKVCSDLVDAQYMLGPKSLWESRHNYHCNCQEGGCYNVRRGEIVQPPLVSMTYDASLPDHGAEFITSPILMGSEGISQLKEIWDIITANAKWNDNLINMHGGASSPSVHLHVSTALDNPTKYDSHNQYREDALHAFSLITPELFALAGLSQYTRGLTYRLPHRMAIYEDQMGQHHGFIHVRRLIPEVFSYVEWRLFEADYENWQYIESAAYLSAVLTRSLLARNGVQKLMQIGYTNPYDDEQMMDYIDDDDVIGVESLINQERLDLLRTLCLDNIDDDHYGQELLYNMFDTVNGQIS